jgi:hypothetical protein
MTATMASLSLIPAASPDDGNECIIVFIYRAIYLNSCSQNKPEASTNVPKTCIDQLHRVSKEKYMSFGHEANRDSNGSPCSSVLRAFSTGNFVQRLYQSVMRIVA